MTYAQLLCEGEYKLSAAGIADAKTDAWYLLSFVTGMTRAEYLLHNRDEIPQNREVIKSRQEIGALTSVSLRDAEAGKRRVLPEREHTAPDISAVYRKLIEKRCAHIPLQHLTGEQEFMGYPFAVSKDVLIPRQDTECLVEEALAKAQTLLQARSRAAAEMEAAEAHTHEQRTARGGKSAAVSGIDIHILDMCTGSGCIAVSLKKLLPQAEVTAVDLSGRAIAVAKQNADRLSADVRFLQGDLFVPVAECFDMIVSNPPYIESSVIETLMPEVRLHEPHMALDGGTDGLDFYRRLVWQAPQHLKQEGWLLVEIGCGQREAVSALLDSNGFINVTCKKDLAGLDRVVCGQLK